MSEPLRNQPAWRELERHHAEIGERHLRELFAADPERGERMVAEGAGLYIDYSKNRITDETLPLLVALAEQTGMPERREQMFRGERINVSEDRSVLHVALRMPRERSLVVDGVDVVKQVHEVLDRMSDFARRVRAGEWLGHTGKPIRNGSGVPLVRAARDTMTPRSGRLIACASSPARMWSLSVLAFAAISRMNWVWSCHWPVFPSNRAARTTSLASKVARSAARTVPRAGSGGITRSRPSRSEAS